MLPIGARAVAWIDKYLEEVLRDFVLDPKETTLFLSHRGAPLDANGITKRIREHVEAASLGKTGSCHLFRHSMATLMLEGGADIRFIQQMLGHASLDTTEIYTRVSIRMLKAVHEATHPGRLEMAKTETAREPSVGADPRTLFASLAAEAAEEDDQLD